MARTESSDAESGPERTCIVTRRKGSPDAMIRFVVGPGTVVVPDIRRKLPGRGVWVTASADRVAEAVERRAFARSFKAEVVATDALPLEIEALLTGDCLQALAMANKAGQVVTGFGKVSRAIVAGEVHGLLQASDGGDDGKRKLCQIMRRAAEGGDFEPPIELFRSDQLDLAFGWSNVIHAALMPGSASRAFLARCRKLALYRFGPPLAGVSNPPPDSTSN